jgi:hypothetical protein
MFFKVAACSLASLANLGSALFLWGRDLIEEDRGRSNELAADGNLVGIWRFNILGYIGTIE